MIQVAYRSPAGAFVLLRDPNRNRYSIWDDKLIWSFGVGRWVDHLLAPAGGRDADPSLRYRGDRERETPLTGRTVAVAVFIVVSLLSDVFIGGPHYGRFMTSAPALPSHSPTCRSTVRRVFHGRTGMAQEKGPLKYDLRNERRSGPKANANNGEGSQRFSKL